MPGAGAGLLVALAQGAERFEHFRHLRRGALDGATPERLPEVRDRYGHRFPSSTARGARHREAASGETV